QRWPATAAAPGGAGRMRSGAVSDAVDRRRVDDSELGTSRFTTTRLQPGARRQLGHGSPGKEISHARGSGAFLRAIEGTSGDAARRAVGGPGARTAVKRTECWDVDWHPGSAAARSGRTVGRRLRTSEPGLLSHHERSIAAGERFHRAGPDEH